MLTITPIPKEVVISEAEKYPELTSNGFNYAQSTGDSHTEKARYQERECLWSGTGPLEIAYAIQYAKENRISPDITSYGVKHSIERWSRARGSYKYICNGCAILGLALSGYEVIVIDKSPNCFFRKKGLA